MKIRPKYGGAVVHAEVWDKPPRNLPPEYPRPTLVYFGSMEYDIRQYPTPGVEPEPPWLREELVLCPLTLEDCEDWRIVLADSEERLQLKEAGYCFN